MLTIRFRRQHCQYRALTRKHYANSYDMSYVALSLALVMLALALLSAVLLYLYAYAPCELSLYTHSFALQHKHSVHTQATAQQTQYIKTAAVSREQGSTLLVSVALTQWCVRIDNIEKEKDSSTTGALASHASQPPQRSSSEISIRSEKQKQRQDVCVHTAAPAATAADCCCPQDCHRMTNDD
jgi:hypothetical protein